MSYPGNIVPWTALLVFAGLGAPLRVPAQTNYEHYTFTTLAGPPESPGWYDGSNNAARFYNPFGVAADSAGNVYVADTLNHTIRKISPAGVATTLAGSPNQSGTNNGVGAAARFSRPNALALDPDNNVYVADSFNHTIRKITPAGAVSDFAGRATVSGALNGTGSAARFNGPYGIAVDTNGTVYVADTYNHKIRKITPAGVVSDLAGLALTPGTNNGTGSGARFNYPIGVAVGTNSTVYVVDASSHTIRKITAAGLVSTLAGKPLVSGTNNGTGSAARFNVPIGIATGSAGNLYVADSLNHALRLVTPDGAVTNLAGMVGSLGSANGTGASARFNSPTGVAVAPGANIYVADLTNNLIRKVTSAGVVSTLAGALGGTGSTDGNVTNAFFSFPAAVAVDAGTNVYVADLANHTIRKISAAGEVTTLAGSPGLSGTNNGNGGLARFNSPASLAVDTNGTVYVADTFNQTIRKITPSGDVTDFAGVPMLAGTNDGTGAAARLTYPYGVTVGTNSTVYVADTFSHTIRKITADGVVTTLAGSPRVSGTNDGTGSAARFSYPEGIAADALGNLYVADDGNHTIRKITADGVVTTLAGAAGISSFADGSGSAARFFYPFGLALDALRNVVVADYSNVLIRKVTPLGAVTTLAGTPGESGFADGTGPTARFRTPEGVAIGPDGAVYVADAGNHAIRRGSVALTDRPVVDAPVGKPGVTRQLDVTNLTTTSWSWRFVRYPANSSAQLSSPTARNPSFTPDVPDLYVLRFEGRDAQGRVAIGTVSVLAETTPPTLKITSPISGRRWSNAVFTVTGTAADDVAIARVRCQVNDGDWVDAVGTTNWSAAMALSPGSNIVRACAIDVAGNASSTNSVGFTYFVAAPLTVTINGLGTITPNHNGKLLEIGKTYTMTALAAAGFAFTDWTGSLTTNSPTLSFVMQSNLTFTANFRDTVKPGLVIQSPLNGQRVLTNSGLVTVRGTTSDNRGLANVFYQLNGGDWTTAGTANNWTNWNATVPMQMGTNVVRAFAEDQAGNRSPTNSVSFQYVVTSPVLLQYVGRGTVTGLTNGQQLELERAYSFNATAGLGFVLTNWTVTVGGIPVSSTNRVPIQFVMKSNLALTVTFADSQRPGLTIQFPLNGARVLTNSGLVTVRGTTTDNWSVTNVFYELNGGDWTNASTANNWTNWNATVAMQIGTNVVRVYAQDQGGNCSPTNSVRFQYVVTSPVTLQYVGKGTVTGLTNSQQLELGRAYQFNALASLGFGFTNWSVAVDAAPVSSTNRLPIQLTMQSNLVLQVTFADRQKPVLTLTSPLSGARITNEHATVRGKVTDNGWVEEVTARLNGGDWWTALGTTNWETDLALQPGTNWFDVYAKDREGLLSPTNRAAYFRVVTNLMTVTKNGKGTITPDYNGKWLEIGRRYSMTATPGLGFVFTNWTDGADVVVTNKPMVSFMMMTNLALRANFVDVQKPTLTVTAPLAGQRWSNAVFTVAGKALDNDQVATVWYQLNTNDWAMAAGTSNWTASVNLTPGPNTLRTYALDATGNRSLTNSVNFTYVLSAQLTVVTVGKGTVTPKDGTMLEIGKSVPVTALPGLGFVLTNWNVQVNGTTTISTNRAVAFVMQSNTVLTATFADIQRPTLTVTSPLVGQRWSNAVFNVAGKAADNDQVATVWYQLNTNDWALAAGTSNWTASVNLTPGPNTLRTYALDATGNRSLTNSVNFTYVLSAQLTVVTVGKGTVTPKDGTMLEIGKSVPVTALPGLGFVLTNWTVEVNGATTISSNRAVAFAMQSNTVLTATFADIQRPTLTVTSPLVGQRWSNAVFNVAGKAADNYQVAAVWYQLNTNDWAMAAGSSNWNGTVNLTSNANTLRVYAVDATGNRSLTNSVNFTYVEMFTLTDYYPLPLGAEWLYDGYDWDGVPAKQVCRVESTNDTITLYTGRATPRSYTTNSVRRYSAYVDRNTLIPYDEWLDYLAVGGRFGMFGDDDDEESLRVDRGFVLPPQMAVGTTFAVALDAYMSGIFVGVANLSARLIEKTSLVVPAGPFADVLHLRFTFTTPDGTQAHDEWWAKSVGCVKAAGVSGDGAPEQWELIDYTMPAAPAMATASPALTLRGISDPRLQFDSGKGNLRLAKGSIQMRLTGPPGAVVVVETSTNLLHWVPLQTNSLPAEGLSVTAPSDQQPRQFFRARMP